MRRSYLRGMTFIEAIVWVAVMTSAMLALGSSLLYFYRANNYSIQEAFSIASAQRTMDLVVRAIRTASYANTGAYPIVSIAPDQIVFYAGVVKGDTLTQQVRFFLKGTTLWEGVTEPSGNPLAYATSTETLIDLSDYVLNGVLATSTFFYYDQNGVQITDFTKYNNVRFVTINMYVDVSTSSLPTQLNLISSAALRNLVGH